MGVESDAVAGSVATRAGVDDSSHRCISETERGEGESGGREGGGVGVCEGESGGREGGGDGGGEGEGEGVCEGEREKGRVSV